MKEMPHTQELLAQFCLNMGMDAQAAAVCRENAFSQEAVRQAYRLLYGNPEGFCACLEQENPQRILALYVQFAQLVQPVYRCWGIPEQIYWDTVADIALWERDYFVRNGVHGLGEYRWLHRHVRMTIFRLGSLQFETQAGPLEAVWNQVPTEPKQLVLHVHIPKGADIGPDAVGAAYQKAVAFWKREEAILLCDSWLLGGDLQQLLPENSRIRSFAAGFTRIFEDVSSHQAEERIFGDWEDDPSRYPASGTCLQRAARAHLMAGGHLAAGYGWQRITTGNG